MLVCAEQLEAVKPPQAAHKHKIWGSIPHCTQHSEHAGHSQLKKCHVDATTQMQMKEEHSGVKKAKRANCGDTRQIIVTHYLNNMDRINSSVVASSPAQSGGGSERVALWCKES